MKETVKLTDSSLVLMPCFMSGVPCVPLGCGEDASEREEKIVVLELEKRIRSKKSQSLRSQLYFDAAAASAWFQNVRCCPHNKAQDSLIFNVSKFLNWLEPNWHPRCHNPAEHRRQLKLDRAFLSCLFLFRRHAVTWQRNLHNSGRRPISRNLLPQSEVGIERF